MVIGAAEAAAVGATNSIRRKTLTVHLEALCLLTGAASLLLFDRRSRRDRFSHFFLQVLA